MPLHRRGRATGEREAAAAIFLPSDVVILRRGKEPDTEVAQCRSTKRHANSAKSESLTKS